MMSTLTAAEPTRSTVETDLPAVSVVIPTLGREQVLLDTIALLLRQEPPPAEILLVDQTPQHEERTRAQLAAWHQEGVIRWLQLPRPSIPGSMNHGLVEARSEIVLFVDDDVVPAPGLIAAHARCYLDHELHAIVGQVLQPGEVPTSNGRLPRGSGLRLDLNVPFNGTRVRDVYNCIACNLSVRRETALTIGGFDEQFVAVAYRFETEFWRRLRDQGYQGRFDPRASLRHLRAARGGTRQRGSHLGNARPDHSVGDYYFALKCGGQSGLAYMFRRLLREVVTRYHLRRPWQIPAKLVGEARGLLWALQLHREGARYLAGSRSSRLRNSTPAC